MAMILSRLRNKVKRDVPECKDAWPDSTDTDSNINSELNDAALEIAYLTICIPKDNESDPIDIVANQVNYTLPTDLLMIDPDGGIQFLDNNSKWDKLELTTAHWLDENEPDWRNASAVSDKPDYCYQRGNNIYIYPKLSVARTNALRVYYGTAPTEMSSDTDEPFNNITYLDPFHYLVALRVKIEAKKALGKFADATILQQEYVARLMEMSNFVSGKRLREYSPDIIQKVKGYWSHFRRR